VPPRLLCRVVKPHRPRASLAAGVARNLLVMASMRTPKLSSLLVAAALTSAPMAAWATPSIEAAPRAATVEVSRTAPVETTPVAATTDDASRYAEREAKDAKAADFRGGSNILVIGGSTLTIVLLVVLIVVLV
jgi:hypothetical protein